MIDRVAEGLGRRLDEVPVGFKVVRPGLIDGSIRFRRRKSLRGPHSCMGRHSVDDRQDGLLLALLASRSGCHRQESQRALPALTEKYGDPVYARVDAPRPGREGRLPPSDPGGRHPDRTGR